MGECVSYLYFYLVIYTHIETYANTYIQTQLDRLSGVPRAQHVANYTPHHLPSASEGRGVHSTHTSSGCTKNILPSHSHTLTPVTHAPLRTHSAEPMGAQGVLYCVAVCCSACCSVCGSACCSACCSAVHCGAVCVAVCIAVCVAVCCSS